MKTSKNPAFPIIIAASSLLVLYKFLFHPTDIYGLISVATGVTGIVLYYRDHRKYDAFFYAWIYLQLPNIYLTTTAGVEIPIANAFPNTIFPFNIGLGFSFTLKNVSGLTIYLNVIPIGLYYLLKFLNVNKPLGKTVSIYRLRKGSFQQIQFPATGMIEKVSGRDKMTAVYQVSLNQEILIKDKSYQYILLEPKNDSLIQVTDKRQVCGLRLCDMPGAHYNSQQNPFVDWVTIDCK